MCSGAFQWEQAVAYLKLTPASLVLLCYMLGLTGSEYSTVALYLHKMMVILVAL